MTSVIGAQQAAAPASGATAPDPTVARPDRRAWGVLSLLSFVYVLNFLDRQLLSILAFPIQQSLQITDGQLGLISGLYFAMFYTFIAIPVGWLADRSNRVTILAVACGIWSAATAACGLARTYPELIIARMTVGFGEAGGVPPSYAIITDTFAPGYRARAFGIFNLGPPIGAAVGIATRDETASQPAAFRDTVRAFFGNPVLVRVSLGGGVTQFMTYGLGNFAVLFLMREKGMTLEQVAVWYALVVGLGMGAGMLVSGSLLDRFTKHTRTAFATAPAISLGLALPFYVGFVWAPNWPLALALLTPAMFLNYFYLSASVALVQGEVKPNQRVLSGALLLLVMNFIGLGLGPTYVGAASDFFAARGYANSLQMALYTLTPSFILAIVIFLSLARRLRREGGI